MQLSRASWSSVVVLVAGACLPAPSARAAVIMTIGEEGPDVVFRASGSVNLSGLTYFATSSWVLPGGGTDSTRVGSGVADAYTGHSGPSLLGPVAQSFFATSATGQPFGLTQFNSRLFVPQGYLSGTPLSGAATYANRTLASMGFTEGTYIYTWGSGANTDTFTIVVAVPAPAAATLMGAGGLVALRRRRRS